MFWEMKQPDPKGMRDQRLTCLYNTIKRNNNNKKCVIKNIIINNNKKCVIKNIIINNNNIKYNNTSSSQVSGGGQLFQPVPLFLPL